MADPICFLRCAGVIGGRKHIHRLDDWRRGYSFKGRILYVDVRMGSLDVATVSLRSTHGPGLEVYAAFGLSKRDCDSRCDYMDQALSGLKTYELIDSGDFNKLEQVGPYRISRPSPQAVWRPILPPSEWKKVDAFFTRFSGGEGKWTIVNKRMEKTWAIRVSGINFRMELTDFGHLGIFAEQAANWLQL